MCLRLGIIIAFLFDLLWHSRAGRQQQLVCYRMSGRLLPLAWTVDCLERLSLYYIERKRSLETLSFPPATSHIRAQHKQSRTVPRGACCAAGRLYEVLYSESATTYSTYFLSHKIYQPRAGVIPQLGWVLGCCVRGVAYCEYCMN